MRRSERGATIKAAMAYLNTLIITSSEKDISSVDSINQNLVADYQAKIDCEIFELKDSKGKLPLTENYNLFFERLKKMPPPKIIVTHPAVFRSAFFLLLIQLLQDTKVEYVFHLYGDFIRQAKRWIILEKYLINKKILFIAPSTSYLNILANLFKNSEVLKEIPFSVNENVFKFSEEKRNAIRKQYKIDDDTSVLIYAGRLSTQKNVKNLSSIVKKINAKIFIVGNEDDFEGATIGESVSLGTNYNSLKEMNNNSNIYFIDGVNQETLVGYLSAADAFISLSLFHDEDFGCAPLESLMVGTPVILTNWGGYQAYSEESSSFCKLLEVEFQENKFFIKNDLTVKEIELFKKTSRSSCRDFYSKRFSHQSVASLLIQALDEDFKVFQGFSEEFHECGIKRKNYFYNQNNKLIAETYLGMYEKFWSFHAK